MIDEIFEQPIVGIDIEKMSVLSEARGKR